MYNKIKNNQVQITGEIITNFTKSHEMFGEGFYTATIKVPRISGTFDQIPITVSDRLLDVTADWQGSWLTITGQLRTFNNHTGAKKRLILSVFVREAESINPPQNFHGKDQNYTFLDGYICKAPTYRKTPFGREIADLLIAVNRPYGKSDYIPCICWGRNARYASCLEVGTRVELIGRIQSREYVKVMEDNTTQIKTAWEVSAGSIERKEEDEC